MILASVGFGAAILVCAFAPVGSALVGGLPAGVPAA
jgi:hypothetical protein